MQTVTVSMRLPQLEVRQLENIAKEMGLDRSTLMKQAIRCGCADLLFEKACAAYRRGEVTLSRAAEMAHITLRDMIVRFQKVGMELNYGVEDLHGDLQA